MLREKAFNFDMLIKKENSNICQKKCISVVFSKSAKYPIDMGRKQY